MTVHGCAYCKERHNRLTSISVHGAIHYDDDRPGVTRSDVGCYGCPQCATNCCASCADETDGICPCGGELIPNMMYHYNGDERLPPEIAELNTTAARLDALEALRQRRPMIVAEYRHYRSLIEMCQEIADTENVPLPENPGLSILQHWSSRLSRYSPAEIQNLFWDYAVPGNIDAMLDLLDETHLQYVPSWCDDYPTTEEGWKELQEKLRDSEGNYEYLVPKRSAAEICEQIRRRVTVIRSAVERRNPDGWSESQAQDRIDVH